MFLRYSAQLEPPAIAFLDASDDDEARRLRALIAEIQQDPTVDEREKIAIVVPPIVFRVLVKDGYWIAYLVRSFEVWIVAMARGESAPTAQDIWAARTGPSKP